jgi:hypothetical protein
MLLCKAPPLLLLMLSLLTSDLSPNAPDVDAAGANDMAAGFNLDLTSSRQPGKGGGGLKGLGLRPAAAAAAAAAADDDDSDDEEAAATRFGSLAANCRKPQRHGAFAATGVVFREEDAAGSGGGLEGSERNAAEVAHLMAKAFADDDDDDDSNRWVWWPLASWWLVCGFAGSLQVQAWLR